MPTLRRNRGIGSDRKFTMYRPLLLTLLLLTSPALLANTGQRLAEAGFATQVEMQQTRLERKNQAVLTYLWSDVYAAAFYAAPQVPPAQALDSRHSKRLELYYFRNIDRGDVIKAAWATLKRQHGPAELERLRTEVERLHASFQDIRPGDRYALDYSPQAGLQLERNGERVFTSDNASLAEMYLGIWLAPDGLSDTLRNSLLGH